MGVKTEYKDTSNQDTQVEDKNNSEPKIKSFPNEDKNISVVKIEGKHTREYSCTECECECECDLFKQCPPPKNASSTPRSGLLGFTGVLSTREEPSEPLPASENRVPGVIASPPTEQIPVPPGRWVQANSRQNTILTPSRDGFESALHHSNENVCNSGTKNTTTDCDIISEDDSSLPVPDLCKNAAKRKSLFLLVRPEKVLCSDICCENSPDLKPPSYFGI